MMKSLLVLALAALGASCFAAARPNFIVIFSDDQTYRAVGYNNPAVKTPNMDRLANEGLRLDRAFVASPICAASRASIYTGMFPQQHGTVGLASESFKETIVLGKRYETLATVMEKAGYHTALYGKSHLGEPTTFGFGEGREIHDPNDDEIFDEGGKFLQRESRLGRPFMLWLTPHNPHLPYTAPQRFKDLYKDTEIKLDPNWRETPLMESFFNQGPAGGPIRFRDTTLLIYPGAPAGLTSGPPRSEANMKEVIKAYYGDVSCLDEHIGKFEEQLKASGLAENTIVIYLSDNGYHLGNHGLGNKITMHEESVRVPMFMHSPLLPVKGAKSDALVSSLDVYPTILDLAGLPASPHLMGRSLQPVMKSPGATVRDYVFSECSGPPENRLGTGHRMVRSDHFKFILSDADEEAFFDLRSDPYELKNLVADAAVKGEVAVHRAKLQDWMKQVGEKRLTAAEIKEKAPQEKKAGPKKRKGRKAEADAAATPASGRGPKGQVQ